MLPGRSSELEELQDVAERARSGGSAKLVIRGESAVDKTVLLDELEALAQDSSREIGSRHFIMPNTVEYHRKKVFQKLGVMSGIQLAKAIRPDSIGAVL